MDEYKKYKDADNLFSKIYYIDWYDGGVTGILKLKDSEHWYLFNLAFFEPDCKLPLKLGHQGLEFFGFSNTLSTKRHPSMVE